MKSLLSFCLLLFSGLACNDMSSRPETADKWKPILVQVNAPESEADPYVTPLLGAKVNLDFYVIAPEGDTAVEAEVISPDAAPLTIPLSTLTITKRTVSPYPGLTLLRFSAEALIPDQASLTAVSPALKDAELVRFRYGLKLSAGDRSLPLYGDFPVYASTDVTGANWSLRGSRILTPEEGAAVGSKVDLNAELDNPQAEPIKIGWYVSAGELKNRRSLSTEWTLPGAGTYTAILTVRGKQSRSTQLALRQVTVP